MESEPNLALTSKKEQEDLLRQVTELFMTTSHLSITQANENIWWLELNFMFLVNTYDY